jgi:hypothetical protein
MGPIGPFCLSVAAIFGCRPDHGLLGRMSPFCKQRGVTYSVGAAVFVSGYALLAFLRAVKARRRTYLCPGATTRPPSTLTLIFA